MSQQWSTVVLKNKGVPVKVQCVSEGGDLLYNSDETPKTEERFVKFTINILSELERIYQGEMTIAPDGNPMRAFGPTAWQDFLRASPVSTTRNIFALMWKLKVEDAGNMMMESELANYAGALVAAYAISEGVDPQVATAAVKQQIDAAVAAARSNFPQETKESADSSS